MLKKACQTVKYIISQEEKETVTRHIDRGGLRQTFVFVQPGATRVIVLYKALQTAFLSLKDKLQQSCTPHAQISIICSITGNGAHPTLCPGDKIESGPLEGLGQKVLITHLLAEKTTSLLLTSVIETSQIFCPEILANVF